jgi:ankyrin repeat protein
MKRVILLFILVLTIFTCKKNSTKGISDIQEESEIDVITDLIRKDQVIQLKKIINNNNINSFNSEGLTPLLIASKERNYDIINYLIKSGENIYELFCYVEDRKKSISIELLGNNEIKIINGFLYFDEEIYKKIGGPPGSLRHVVCLH